MKFGFIIHPLNLSQLRAFALNTAFVEHFWQPHEFAKAFLRDNKELLDAPDTASFLNFRQNGILRVHSFDRVISATGASTSGIVVSIPMVPEAILNEQPVALDMLRRACEKCQEWGAEIIGLGAYTAIVGSRGEWINQAAGIPVTTGNSYTVHSALLALETILDRIGRSLSGKKVIVIGFQGSIGLAISKILARRGIDLVLIGRGSARYLPKSLSAAIEEAGINVEVYSSVEEGVKQGDVVISATSTGQILDQNWLLPGTLVIDVAQPRDVRGQRMERPDILVIDGGLVRLPRDTLSTSLFDSWTFDTVFSCLAETVILALENRAEPFSVGRELNLEKIEEIGRLGEKHGLMIDGLLSFGAPVERSAFSRLRKTEYKNSPARKRFLISVEKGLQTKRAEVYRRYRSYVDPFLASALEVLNLNKNFVKAEGVYLWDDEGNRYLDFSSNFGAVNVGHNHPKVVGALEAVLTGKVPNFVKPSTGQLMTALAETLATIAPGDLDTCFFCNSGTEANEGALKLARLFTGRTRIAYAAGGFHGKTFGSLSVTDNEKFRRPFEPLVPDCVKVPYGALPQLEETLKAADVAAFIVEPIQGEGGIIVPPDGYLKAAERLCKNHGTLMILDEVQTGLGRTGKMFAAEHWELAPDIMTVAKSLSGGLIPIGAYITTAEIWDKTYGQLDHYNLHTSTFGGNNLGAAAGLATLHVMEDEGLIERARTLGDYFYQRIGGLASKYKIVRQVRGKGLMLGVEFDDFLTKIFHTAAVKRMLDHFPRAVTAGLSGLTAGLIASVGIIGEFLNEHRIVAHVTLHNSLTLRIQPPLTITQEQVDYFTEALDRLCHKMEVIAEMCGNLDSAAWSR